MIVTISSYIANLVCFLNFDIPPTETEKIQSVEDLADQNRVYWGTVKGGSTEAFFRVRIYYSFGTSVRRSSGRRLGGRLLAMS